MASIPKPMGSYFVQAFRCVVCAVWCAVVERVVGGHVKSVCSSPNVEKPVADGDHLFCRGGEALSPHPSSIAGKAVG